MRVNNLLQGTLDYLLRKNNNLIVIEAKQADLTKGFTQLAIELIAVDQWTDSIAKNIYGAVTTGDIWQFGILDRENKLIHQGVNLFVLLDDLEVILRGFLAILID